MQREIARNNNVIMDGRDIGTVVLPHADVKIFLTASAEVRAQRRLLELEAKGQKTDRNRVLQEILQRDEQDRTRKIAPLVQAKDAILLDSSEMSREETVAAVLSTIRERIGV